MSQLKTLDKRSAGLSDIGLGRKRNEDAFVRLDSLGFYALADGMGGHPSGDIAAHQLLLHMCRMVRIELPHLGEADADHFAERIGAFIEGANGYLYDLGKTDPALKGMGSTLSCLALHGEHIVFGHVGDSRIYRWREGELEQLTEDHTLLRELSASGMLYDQKIQKRVRGVLTRAMGTRPSVKPEIGLEVAAGGDIYLLSSDGLCDVVCDEQIGDILRESASIEEASTSLVEAARGAGGRDNITTLLLQLEEAYE